MHVSGRIFGQSPFLLSLEEKLKQARDRTVAGRILCGCSGYRRLLIFSGKCLVALGTFQATGVRSYLVGNVS